jgi:hypothetical protein
MGKKTPGSSSNRGIYLYLKLTLTLSAPLWILIIWSGHLNMAFGLIIPVLMWCPAIAAWVTCRLTGRDFRKIAWSWPKATQLVSAYFIPLGYASLAYGLVWALHLAGWNTQFVAAAVQDLGLKELPTWASLTICIILMATGGVIENLSTTLGEEIGWRGISGSGTGEKNVLYAGWPGERPGVGCLAYALGPVCGLQRRHQQMVFLAVFQSYLRIGQLYACLDAHEIRKHMAGRFAACQSRSLHPCSL